MGQLLVSEKPGSMMSPASFSKLIVRGPGFEAERVDELCLWKHPWFFSSPQTHILKGAPQKMCPRATDVHDMLNLHHMDI